MSAEEEKGKEEKTTACGDFERMFGMMSQCWKGGGSLPDCLSMMRIIEKCCGPKTENKSEEGNR